MTTNRELALQALAVAIESVLPEPVILVRNATEPSGVPEDGLVVLRDGQSEEPEMTIGRNREYHWQHQAVASIVVQGDDEETRRLLADKIVGSIADGIEHDNTLGVTAFSLSCRAGTPTVDHERVEGAAPSIVVELPIHLHFVSESPVG